MSQAQTSFNNNQQIKRFDSPSNSTSTVQPNMPQQPNKLPLNFELLNLIVMTSKYIPETKRNAYLTQMQKYEHRSLLWQMGLLSYYAYNFAARKTKWWRLTTNIKTTIFRSLGFIWMIYANGLRQVGYSIKFIEQNNGLLRQNWENIMQQLNMHANKDIMAFQSPNNYNPQNKNMNYNYSQDPRGTIPEPYNYNNQNYYNTQQNFNPQHSTFRKTQNPSQHPNNPQNTQFWKPKN